MTQPPDVFDQNIFIIESPSPGDVFDGRREGKALLEALRLAHINCEYYDIANRDMLARCVTEIDALDPSTTRFALVKHNYGIVPHPLGRTVNLRTLHFSAHG